MKAILHTRCGCKRKMLVKDLNELHIPLHVVNWTGHEFITDNLPKQRRFVFHHTEYEMNDWGEESRVAHFVELG